MNKGKIVTSIGAILLTTGIIGGAYSGVLAMPKVINNIQNVENNLNKEDILYKGEINLTKLNINSKTSNVTIKKYDGQNVIVGRNGDKDISTISTKENGNELTINEEVNTPSLGNNIDGMVKYFVNQLYSAHSSNITVYVPDNIDINVNTNYGRLNVYDSNINTLNFNTSNGNIALNENSKVNNLNIKSNSFISLQVREAYCTNNLNIECSNVNIYEDSIINDKTKVPDNVKIFINNTNSYDENESIDIKSNLPIAKNLEITSNETVDLNLPILDYKFNFDIKALNSISFDINSKSKYLATTLKEYIKYGQDGRNILNKSSIEGLINENLKDNPLEYLVNIRSANVIFE